VHHSRRHIAPPKDCLKLPFEITIEGPGNALAALRPLLVRHIGDSGIASPRLSSNGMQTLVLRESDSELLDATLIRIAALIKTVEQRFGAPDLLAMRVRNLAYAEPSCGHHGDPEPFSPISSLTIQPWSSSLPEEPSSETIVLDSRHAFGTGKHPSTLLCLEILQNLAHGNDHDRTFDRWSVLDFGCGSGLLAIAAVRLGAAQGVGVEIDASSALTARRNVEINGLSDRIQIREGSWDVVHETYDLILANLVPSVLLRSGTAIPARLQDQGAAVVSGFGKSRLDEMAAFFSQVGLAVQGRYFLKTWGALLLVRNHRPQ
jgi:ribosomal protein L11 methylase PrmA